MLPVNAIKIKYKCSVGIRIIDIYIWGRGVNYLYSLRIVIVIYDLSRDKIEISFKI